MEIIFQCWERDLAQGEATPFQESYKEEFRALKNASALTRTVQTTTNT